MATAIAPYSGYRPRSMRTNKNGSDGTNNRSGKRNRLSKAKADKVLYTSAKGWKQNPDRYAEICDIADKLNGRRVVVTE